MYRIHTKSDSFYLKVTGKLDSNNEIVPPSSVMTSKLNKLWLETESDIIPTIDIVKNTIMAVDKYMVTPKGSTSNFGIKIK